MDADARAPWPDELTGVRDALDATFRHNPFVAHLGASLTDWGPGWAEVALEAGREHMNMLGGVHGGVIAGVADAAFEVACNSYGRQCVAIELSCHYSRGVTQGTRLTARAAEVTRTRRLRSYRIEVSAGDDTVIAWFMALAYCTEQWHLGEDRYPASWRERY